MSVLNQLHRLRHVIKPLDAIAFSTPAKLVKKEDTPRICQACERKGLNAYQKLVSLLMNKTEMEVSEEYLGSEVDKEWLADIDKEIESAERKLEAAQKAKKAEIIGRKTWYL